MLTSATIDTVHDATGRIDAMRVGELFSMKPPAANLRSLAMIFGQKYETLRKNPSRDEAQPSLSKLVHAWNQLQTFWVSGTRSALAASPAS